LQNREGAVFTAFFAKSLHAGLKLAAYCTSENNESERIPEPRLENGNGLFRRERIFVLELIV
jgi:hypothetical protein